MSSRIVDNAGTQVVLKPDCTLKVRTIVHTGGLSACVAIASVRGYLLQFLVCDYFVWRRSQMYNLLFGNFESLLSKIWLFALIEVCQRAGTGTEMSAVCYCRPMS